MSVSFSTDYVVMADAGALPRLASATTFERRERMCNALSVMATGFGHGELAILP